MEDKNHSTLRDAIQKLPVHSPAPGVWDRISEELDAAGKKTTARSFLYSFSRLQLAAVISALLLLSAGLLWRYQSGQGIPEQPATIQEKELDPALPLSKAEITEYDHQLAAQEEMLRKCIDQLPEAESEKIQPSKNMLDAINQLRDNMIRLLDEQGDNPAAMKRLQSLEKKRRELIGQLQKEACESVVLP
ncbi:MAG: hypothetical protein R3C61_19085 [Bacteroidia bacterium]